MKFGLVLLTYNEIEGISALWDKIPHNGFDEYFAVDGNSTDGTLEFFKEKNLTTYCQTKKGRGDAFRLAFESSKSDVLIFFSPDGNEDPADILKIKEGFLAEVNTDLIIASRMMKGAVNEEDDLLFKWRKWANNAFNLLANLFFNRSLFSVYITDSINGFRGFRRSAFYKLNLDAMGYTIEYQSTIRSFKNKLNIREIPTREGERIGGESYAKSIPTGIAFLKCFGRELFV
jgi:glycosyltransferase involved in cell wall biosynthesis